MTTTTNNANLSASCLAYFLALAADAANWSGAPCLGANVTQGRRENGFLTDLKKKGLLTTQKDEDGWEWVYFTDAGKDLAAAHGHAIDDIRDRMRAAADRLESEPEPAVEVPPMVRGLEADSDAAEAVAQAAVDEVAVYLDPSESDGSGGIRAYALRLDALAARFGRDMEAFVSNLVADSDGMVPLGTGDLERIHAIVAAVLEVERDEAAATAPLAEVEAIDEAAEPADEATEAGTDAPTASSPRRGVKRGEGGVARATRILEDAGVPMHIDAIFEAVIADGWTPGGKTPKATLHAGLCTAAQKPGSGILRAEAEATFRWGLRVG